MSVDSFRADPGPASTGREAALRAGIAALEAGEFRQATARLEPLYHARPDDLEVLLVLGLALAGSFHPDLAADLLDEVAQRRPDAPHPAVDLERLLRRAGRADALAEYFAAARALAPHDARLALAEGEWQQAAGEPEVARACFARALALRPGWVSAELGLAATLAAAGQVPAAIAKLEALLGTGQPSVEALSNLGVLLGAVGRTAEALERFEQARRLDPRHVRVGVNHGMALLKAGRLAEGWAAFDARMREPGRALLPVPLLLPLLAPGQRLDGRTVLVTYDSGFGDTLQFVRFVPALRARGARVLVWVPDPLRRLFEQQFGADAVLSGDVRLPRFDWHTPIMRLGLVLGVGLDEVGVPMPYVTPDPALVEHWARRLPPEGRRIGLVWAGSSRAHDRFLAEVDGRRSLPLRALAPLGAMRGISWISLQAGEAPRAQMPVPGLDLHDPMGAVRDFADTAAIIASLDAVVSVDTAVVHLAGAMDKPVLMLDRFDNCWRWLTEREDSPWYPSLRIFRQERWGEWAPVVRRVAAALRG